MTIEQKIAELLNQSKQLDEATNVATKNAAPAEKMDELEDEVGTKDKKEVKKVANVVTKNASAPESSEELKDGVTAHAGDEEHNAKNNVKEESETEEEVETIEETSHKMKKEMMKKEEEDDDMDDKSDSDEDEDEDSKDDDEEKKESYKKEMKGYHKMPDGKMMKDSDHKKEGMKKEMKKEEITVDVKEDVDALINGEELSEEFKTKAATIFEAAVLNRVKQEVAKLEESYEAKLVEQKETISEGLVEKVDGYLNLMVEQWVEQNALALESGMKSEILEGFIGGLKGLFEEHYIDIPEEKFDVLGEMEDKVEDLESKLNESVDNSIELKKQLDTMLKEKAIAESAIGLTDTEVEKFNGLAEELSYEDVDTFKSKLQTIRENYFVKKATADVKSVVTDEPVAEEKVLNESISRYVQALGKTKFN